MVQPVGDWGRPVDLHLTTSSLKGIHVAVRCGIYDEEDKIQETFPLVCDALKDSLEDLGAEIGEGDKLRTADLTLWYLEKGQSSGDLSGFASIAYMASNFVLPSVRTSSIGAELRIIDHRGVLLETAPVRAEVVQAFGLMALWPMASEQLKHRPSEKERKQELESRFIRYAQNKVYSHSVSVRETGRETVRDTKGRQALGGPLDKGGRQ